MSNIERTRKVLTGARWVLITGLVFYSLMTTTPFVAAHSEWEWSGAILGLIVDAAFIMSLSADSTLATLGVTDLGKWPVAFRWFTGLCSVFLNVWVSVARGDWVGVAVHMIAPALVMLLAEVGPVYLAALARAEAAAQDQARTDELVGTLVNPPLADWERELAEEPEALPELSVPTEPIVEAVETMVHNVNVATAAHTVPPKLSRTEANDIIRQGWKHQLPINEVAVAAGRHPATVRRKFKEFDAELAA